MKKRDMIKGVLGFTASVGAGMIVTSITRATTPVDAGKVVKIFRGVGMFAIGGLVGDAAEGWIGKQVDNLAAGYDAIVGVAKGTVQEIKNEAQAAVPNITKLDKKEK